MRTAVHRVDARSSPGPKTMFVAPTSTAVSCLPGTVGVGMPSQCTATVTDTASSGPSTPVGTVASAAANFGRARARGSVSSTTARDARARTCLARRVSRRGRGSAQPQSLPYRACKPHIASAVASPCPIWTSTSRPRARLRPDQCETPFNWIASVCRHVISRVCPRCPAFRSRHTTEKSGVPGSSPGLANPMTSASRRGLRHLSLPSSGRAAQARHSRAPRRPTAPRIGPRPLLRRLSGCRR
jgi:hypothetical protein